MELNGSVSLSRVNTVVLSLEHHGRTMIHCFLPNQRPCFAPARALEALVERPCCAICSCSAVRSCGEDRLFFSRYLGHPRIGRGGLSIEQIEAELLSVTAARQDERQAGGAAAAAGPSEPTANDDDDAELEAELERELMAQQGDNEEDEGVPVTAERLGPAVPEDDVAEAGHPGQQLFHINENSWKKSEICSFW